MEISTKVVDLELTGVTPKSLCQSKFLPDFGPDLLRVHSGIKTKESKRYGNQECKLQPTKASFTLESSYSPEQAMSLLVQSEPVWNSQSFHCSHSQCGLWDGIKPQLYPEGWQSDRFIVMQIPLPPSHSILFLYLGTLQEVKYIGLRIQPVVLGHHRLCSKGSTYYYIMIPTLVRLSSKRQDSLKFKRTLLDPVF